MRRRYSWAEVCCHWSINIVSGISGGWALVQRDEIASFGRHRVTIHSSTTPTWHRFSGTVWRASSTQHLLPCPRKPTPIHAAGTVQKLQPQATADLQLTSLGSEGWIWDERYWSCTMELIFLWVMDRKTEIEAEFERTWHPVTTSGTCMPIANPTVGGTECVNFREHSSCSSRAQEPWWRRSPDVRHQGPGVHRHLHASAT